MPPDPKECLLCDVFRHRAVQAHPPEICENAVLMRDHDPAECEMVAAGGLADVAVTVQTIAPDALYTGVVRNGYRVIIDTADQPPSQSRAFANAGRCRLTPAS